MREVAGPRRRDPGRWRAGLGSPRPTVGIDQCVALAAFDLLARVIAPWSTSFDGLVALAVNHRRRWAGLPAVSLAIDHVEMVVDGLEQALAPVAQKPAIDRRHRREILGQKPACDASQQHIEDPVHDLAHWRLARPSCPCRRRHERRENRPLRIGQIASLTQIRTARLPKGGRCPHGSLQAGFDSPLEAHMDPTFHPIRAFQGNRLVVEKRQVKD
jgi:hypothetical protein